MYSLLDSRYDFKGPWDAFGKESTECRRKAVRNRAAIINNAYLHAIHNAKVMARPAQVCGEGAGGERGRDVAQVCAGSHSRSSSRSRSLLMQEKSEARWRDYAADNYYHHYYRYGENEEGEPLAEAHRNDDLLELAAEAVKDLMTYKHYEGGKTITGVGKETGFAFTRRRLGCYCVPAAGESCCHVGWTGELDRGVVVPASARSAATRPSGPPTSFREGIDMSSLLCMPGDEDDETADGESIWFVNALGVQCQDLILPFPLCCRLPASLPCLPLTKIGPRVSAATEEEQDDVPVRPMHAGQEPLQRPRGVARTGGADRGPRDIQGLADGTEPHRGDTSDGHVQLGVGEGGRGQVLHDAHTI